MPLQSSPIQRNESRQNNQSSPSSESGTLVVLDTNVVLDLLVFHDARCNALRDALSTGRITWLATRAMHDELQRVLDYPQIQKRLRSSSLTPEDIGRQVHQWAQWTGDAPKAPYTCKDPDDQRFIDLAVAHRAQLVSKDLAVLTMARRLKPLGVQVLATWEAPMPRHWPA